ncbi:MAG TPA: universal stress protein [Gemmatimonadaceae bacterium]|nr:universal stress protein [Gemmatimonadaceae bacterium]
MYRVIMVPTDGTGFDREAIRVALRIAERTGAKVKLVRVLGTGSFLAVAVAAEGTAVATEIVRSERDRALGELYALAAECRALSNVDIGVDLHAGPVTDVLEDYARRHEVDLIVISTHGRSGLARMSLGSVTDSLIRHTSIPVLVVKPPTSYLNPQAGKAFTHVVVPLDGSSLAEQILPPIVSLASVEGADMTLLHVIRAQPPAPREITSSGPAWWEKDIKSAQSYLERVSRQLRRRAGLRVDTDIVVSQSVPGAISDFAAREKIDLIAIATHGRGGLARMLRGSVADAVLHQANISMLVLRPDNVLASEATLENNDVLFGSWRSVELLPVSVQRPAVVLNSPTGNQ